MSVDGVPSVGSVVFHGGQLEALRSDGQAPAEGDGGPLPVDVAPPQREELALPGAGARSKPLVKMPLRARRLHGLDIDLVVECLELTDEPVGVPFWVVAAEVVGSQVIKASFRFGMW